FIYQPVRDANGQVEGILVIALEVTDQVLARNRIRDSEALLEHEKRVLELIATGSPLSATLKELAQGIEAHFAQRGPLASVLLLEEDGLHLRHGAGPSLPEAYNRAIDGIALGPAAGSCGTAAFRGHPVIVSDIAHDPLWKDFAKLALSHGLRACWSTPITGSTGKLLGTFAIYYPRPGLPTDQEKEAVGLLVRTAAIAIEHARVEKERQRLVSIVENSSDFIGLSDLQGNPIYVNPAGRELVGIDDLQQVRRSKVPDYFIPQQREFVEQLILPAIVKDGRWSGELTFQHFKTGAPIPVFYDIFRVNDPKTGKPINFATITRDITERKRNEELLRQHRERFDLVAEASQVGFWFCDLPFDKLIWDERVKEHFWLPPDADVTIDTFYERIHPEDRERTRQAIADSNQNNTRYDIEYRTLALDVAGREKWVRAIGRTFYGPQGQPLRFDGVTLDITATRSAQEEIKALLLDLQQRLAEHEAIMQVVPVGIAVAHDPAGGHITANAGFSELLGAAPGENVSLSGPHAERLTYRVLLDGKELPPDELPVQRAALTGIPVPGQVLQLQYADGRLVHLLGSANPLFDQSGTVRGAIGAFMDITAQKRTEDALLESKERFRFVMESMPQKVFTARPSGQVDYFNRQWMEYTGLTFEAIRDWGWIQFIHPEDVQENIRLWQHSIATGEPFQFEHRFRRADGSYRWHLSRAHALPDSEGKVVMWIGTNTDIEDRKQSEDALRKSEKLAVVGRLAATIAHEINNPLEAVTNLLYLIQHESNLDELKNFARQANEELARVTHVVTHTLRFHRQSTTATHEQLSSLLDSAIAIYQGRLLNSGIEIRRDYRDPHPILCFASELRQVFANFIGNAFDATRLGGYILLRTREATDLHTGARGVRVTIADNGHGMDPPTLQRIFEPFFTTKGIHGTGLGLWVSADILRKHHARVRVKSRPTEGPQIEANAGPSGTIFSLFFPWDAAP
ncbi:MAG: PAS domain S-box protein, partial [Acidobacteriaceae bacterium]